MYPRIKYILIGNSKEFLIDYYKEYGEFVDYTINSIFPLVQNSKKRGIYIWTSHHYDYIYEKHQNGVVILSMIEKGFKKDLAIIYLNEIYENLLKVYNIQESEDFSITDFKIVLEKTTFNFNNNYIDLVQRYLIETTHNKSVLVESLDKITERASQYEELQKKMKDINDNEYLIIEKSNKINYLKQIEKKNILVISSLILLVSILLYLILSLFCGGFDLKRCF